MIFQGQVRRFFKGNFVVKGESCLFGYRQQCSRYFSLDSAQIFPVFGWMKSLFFLASSSSARLSNIGALEMSDFSIEGLVVGLECCFGTNLGPEDGSL